MMKKTIVFKKTASLVLALLMIVSVLAVVPFGASAAVGEGKGWADSDTENNIYYIATPADMKSFQSTSAAQAAGAKVYLTDDIDMSEVNDWAPIGNFYGTFDGQNHTIKGLKYTSTSGNNQSGLIKILYAGGVVQNLIVDGWEVSAAGNWSGLLIGTADYGDTKLENIHVKNSSFSSSNSNNFVGALFGRGTTLTSNTNGKISIVNCSVVDTTVTTAGHSAGAFVGDFDKATANATVSNCYSNATVSANKNAGGLVGYLVNGSCTIEKSAYAGDISTTTTTAVGGLVGLAGTSSAGNLTISDCAFIGTINEANSDIALVGDSTAAKSVELVRCVAAENFDAQKDTLLANGWVTTGDTVTVDEAEVTVLVPASVCTYFTCAIPTTDVYYQKKENGNGTVDIRFVAVLNDLSYANVGFNVQATRGEGDGAQTSNTITKTTTTVYKSVTALGETVTAETLGGQYIYVIEIKNVDVTTYAHSFNVSAFVTVQDGTNQIVWEAATQTATVAKAS